MKDDGFKAGVRLGRAQKDLENAVKAASDARKMWVHYSMVAAAARVELKLEVGRRSESVYYSKFTQRELADMARRADRITTLWWKHMIEGPTEEPLVFPLDTYWGKK